MRLVTWNVNSLRARLPRVLELLAEHQPDVVCLQETKCTAESFPAAELAGAGYRATHHSAGRWAGVALLGREDLELSDSSIGLPGEPDPAQARWCEATIRGIRFASAYVPNGRALDSKELSLKLAFLDAVAERVGALRGRPLVVAGDLNVAPADDDVYDPAAFVGSTHVTPAERVAVERILAQGLVDAYRELHPAGRGRHVASATSESEQPERERREAPAADKSARPERGFTWWDYRAGHFHRGLGMRIDLALLSPDLAARLSACGIDRAYRKGAKPSDHAPLLVELA
ncbi:MAG: exodeoxyribonuclease III [Solirubrobacteraceae bacterium]